MSIPPIIHYCWFGKGPKSPVFEKCFASWKQFHPDWEIREWNEDHFDVISIPYVHEAYQHKKYAFVSDYVRLHALYQHGGVYMDTDVELIKPLTPLCSSDAFVGFETSYRIATCLLAFSAGHSLLEEWMSLYQKRQFVVRGRFDTTPNTAGLTALLQQYGLHLDGSYQKTAKGITVYPQDYFSPDLHGEKADTTDNTYAIHWFDASWVSGIGRFKLNLLKIIKKFIGTAGYRKAAGVYQAIKNRKFRP